MLDCKQLWSPALSVGSESGTGEFQEAVAQLARRFFEAEAALVGMAADVAAAAVKGQAEF